MAPGGIGNSLLKGSDERGNSRDNDNDGMLTNNDIVIIDGGFATQLSCHVNQPIDGDVLWSARFLATNKEAVIDTHLDFLRAGANLIITNSYQASIDLFMEHLNLSKDESYKLIKESVKLAKIAVKRFIDQFPNSQKPLIAGSVGPYGAHLHDGSEYNGSYAKFTTIDTMREWHIPRIRALVEAGVDLLAIETIPCKVEAEMLVNLLKTDFPSIKAWVSFSSREDGKSIAFGENFQETAKYCYDLNPNQIIAVGLNCLAPRLVESFINGFNENRKNNPVPLIVYPNSGESYTVELGWINRDQCEPVSNYVQKWLDLGVKWVGGCCRTYAIEVTKIKDVVEKWKAKRQCNVDQINGNKNM